MNRVLIFIALLCCVASTLDCQNTHAVQEDQYSFEAYYRLKPDSNEGYLFVRGEIQDGWVIYSVSTPVGGPLRSTIKVLPSRDFKITGPFEPAQDPQIKFVDVFEINAELHKNEVLWSAPIIVATGADRTGLTPTLKLNGQCCSDDDTTCLLVTENLTAEYSPEPFAAPPGLEPTFQAEDSHTVWTGNIHPANVMPGDTVTVTWNANPTDGHKIYSYKPTTQDTIAQPTRIAFSKSNGWVVSEVTASAKPRVKEMSGEKQESYNEPIAWSLELTVPDHATEGTFEFAGLVGYQNCTDEQCDAPASAEFRFNLTVGKSTGGESELVFQSGGSYSKAGKLADRKAKEDADIRKDGARNFASDAK